MQKGKKFQNSYVRESPAGAPRMNINPIIEETLKDFSASVEMTKVEKNPFILQEILVFTIN